MRIERLEIENFKGFRRQTLDLHPQFTLLVGENGSGKTSVLDALAVAAGIWLVEPPDLSLAGSGRIIMPWEIRLEAEFRGDRVQFSERRPVIIRAVGEIGEHGNVTWARQIREGGKRTSNGEAKEALAYIRKIYEQDSAGKRIICPVLAYYGAGRAWLPRIKRFLQRKKSNSLPGAGPASTIASANESALRNCNDGFTGRQLPPAIAEAECVRDLR